MPSSELYRLFEHTADLGVEVNGVSLEEAITRLLLALYDLHVSIDTIEPKVERRLEVYGETLEDAVVYLLEEALFLFDTEGFIARIANVEITDGRITATMKGEFFAPERHIPKFEIKAITYHQLSIKETKDGYTIRVVFDV